MPNLMIALLPPPAAHATALSAVLLVLGVIFGGAVLLCLGFREVYVRVVAWWVMRRWEP